MFMLLMSLTTGAVRKPKSLNMLKESGLSATRRAFGSFTNYKAIFAAACSEGESSRAVRSASHNIN